MQQSHDHCVFLLEHEELNVTGDDVGQDLVFLDEVNKFFQGPEILGKASGLEGVAQQLPANCGAHLLSKFAKFGFHQEFYTLILVGLLLHEAQD